MTPRNAIPPGKKAWEQYVESEIVDQRLVRSEIARSWKRCRDLQVNPLQNARGELVPTHILQDRQVAREQLIRVARPFLQELLGFAGTSQLQVVLADRDGLLLETLGAPQILSHTRSIQLCPGGNWSEAAKGTNAVGTAVVERRPVQIFAWEHYCEENQFLTCSAAPILDPAGEVVAVLDISSEAREHSPHILGMVVAAARAIENALHLDQARRRLYVIGRVSDALVHGVSDGVVAVDARGVITDLNARGGEILGVSPARARGASLRELCGDRAPILTALATCRDNGGDEVLVDRRGKRVRGAAAAVRDERGEVVGALALFRELDGRPGERKAPAIRAQRTRFEDILGTSAAISAARDAARQAAASSSTILMLGESGSGKELFVKAIHDASARSDRPLVAINCAALPESLIESELFGYCDGSFTGARRGGQAGKFELADGGTLFLDEIGDMPLHVQSKLLRVLQERRVSRIGGAAEVPVDIRVIAATHRDLRAEARRGAFREDLYYRLAVLEIMVPPLRHRLEDVPFLAERISAKVSARLGRPPVQLDPVFVDRLCAYGWPGNVRELENVIERAINRAAGGVVLTADLLDLDRAAPAVAAAPRASAPAPRPTRTLREVEKETIAEVLAACAGNVLRAAATLGIGRNTLYRKIERYGLGPVEAVRRASAEE